MPYTVAVSGPRFLRDFQTARPMLDALGYQLRPSDKLDTQQHLDEDDLIELGSGVDAFLCGGDRFTARVFDALPALKVVCKWGTGVDAIDLQAAQERGVLVRNVPDAFSVPVAESVMAYLLMFARRQPWLTQELRAGRWTRLDGHTLGERTLGVVGLGAIGSTVARRAAAFGMRILGCDPKPTPLQLIDDTGLVPTDLDTLLTESDYVSINCDLNPTSRHLIDEDSLRKMKPSAVLINTARGPCVDQEALARALEAGTIAGAGLDVFETEPLGDHPLSKMDSVLLSPHLAQASPRACTLTHERVVQNVRELLDWSGRGPGEDRDPEAYQHAVMRQAGGLV